MIPTRAIFIHGGTKPKIKVYRDGNGIEYFCDADIGTNPTSAKRRVKRLEHDTNGNLINGDSAGSGEYQHPADSLATVQGLSYL